MSWHTIPRDLLEQQFDSLGLERNHFETGVTDPDSINGTEKLSDYPDPEEDARCAGSLEGVSFLDSFLKIGVRYQYVRCHVCGKTVVAELRRRKEQWVKATHHAAPLESEGPVQ